MDVNTSEEKNWKLSVKRGYEIRNRTLTRKVTGVEELCKQPTKRNWEDLAAASQLGQATL